MRRAARLAATAFVTALAAALVAGAAGCGNSRTPVPPLGAPSAPDGLRTLFLTTARIIVDVPRTWMVVTSPGPLLATVSSGSAVVALWAYPRAAAPPTTARARRATEAALLAAVRARDPSLQPIRVATITLNGQPAVELDALEHVAGQLRRVRSVHVYAPGREVVLDAYAPPATFHPVDHAVFSPVGRSLRLLGPA